MRRQILRNAAARYFENLINILMRAIPTRDPEENSLFYSVIPWESLCSVLDASESPPHLFHPYRQVHYPQLSNPIFPPTQPKTPYFCWPTFVISVIFGVELEQLI